MPSRLARAIVNPAASGGAARHKWPHIRKLLAEEGFSLDYIFTEGTGHATQIAREAALQGYSLVVAVGGDGTVNEVVNGLVAAAGEKGPTLGIISTGTGCDFVRSLGIHQDYRRACRQLSRAQEVPIDIGVIEYTHQGQKLERLFVNAAGLGFDAAVVETMKRRFKAVGSKTLYVLGVLLTLPSYHSKDITLTVDGRSQHLRAFSVVIANGAYFGGGMRYAPGADLSDGLFDVVQAGDLPKRELLWQFPTIYLGTHVNHPKIHLERASRVEVTSSQRLPLQADGELLGEAPARFWVLPSALRVAMEARAKGG